MVTARIVSHAVVHDGLDKWVSLASLDKSTAVRITRSTTRARVAIRALIEHECMIFRRAEHKDPWVQLFGFEQDHRNDYAQKFQFLPAKEASGESQSACALVKNSYGVALVVRLPVLQVASNLIISLQHAQRIQHQLQNSEPQSRRRTSAVPGVISVFFAVPRESAG